MINVKKIPNKITKMTATVEIMDALSPCIFPAMKIVAIDIKKGNLPIARDKIIS